MSPIDVSVPQLKQGLKNDPKGALKGKIEAAALIPIQEAVGPANGAKVLKPPTGINTGAETAAGPLQVTAAPTQTYIG